ncbi:hypothetical protein RDWZM_004142, partial [Blomia tropicalis]
MVAFELTFGSRKLMETVLVLSLDPLYLSHSAIMFVMLLLSSSSYCRNRCGSDDGAC